MTDNQRKNMSSMNDREGHISEDGKSFIYDVPAPKPDGAWGLMDVPNEFRGAVLYEAQSALFALLSGSEREMVYVCPEGEDGPVWFMYLSADSGVMTAPDSE